MTTSSINLQQKIDIDAVFEDANSVQKTAQEIVGEGLGTVAITWGDTTAIDAIGTFTPSAVANTIEATFVPTTAGTAEVTVSVDYTPTGGVLKTLTATLTVTVTLDPYNPTSLTFTVEVTAQ